MNLFDRIFVDGWRDAGRLWSIRVSLFWIVVGAFAVLLTLISDEVKSLIGWGWFAVIFMVATVSIGVARLLKQPGAKANE